MICERIDCGNILSGYQKKYCSKSCAAKVNNLGKRRHGEAPGNCLFCDKKLLSSQTKYCSYQCDKKHKWEQRKSIIEFNEFETRTPVAKRYLIEIRGHRCEICNRTEWEGNPIPLVLDHIDGDSDNNYLTNLRNVCGNCDMLLPTYKSKNRGNGRHSRRLRYAEGKSY